MTAFCEQDILAQLDACTVGARLYAGELEWDDYADRHEELKALFPDVDHDDWDLIGMRLTAYAGPTHWAMIIERTGLSTCAAGHDAINTFLFCYGNCLVCKPGHLEGNVLQPTSDGEQGPTFSTGADADWTKLTVAPSARAMRVRGRSVVIPRATEVYEEAGLPTPDAEHLCALDMLRALRFVDRDLLHAADEELRARLTVDVPLLLRLHEWYHPNNVIADPPSRCKTFQMIAKVLVTRDPSHYRPSRASNTHWSRLGEGG